jgi:hypothetical protein
MYTEQRNNPSISNERKQIFSSRMDETGPPKPPQPLINFQYYQPKPPPKPQNAPDATTFMPTYVPNPFVPPQFGYTYQHPLFPPAAMPPIIKNYEINVGGPAGSHEQMNMIYEDILPNKPLTGSFCTMAERLTTYNFIRSTIFNSSDGENIGLTGNDVKSLLSHVRFDELNPYNTYKFSMNPYRGLPDNFLIYRSCYPIRHSDIGSTVICAKDSSSVNIRIYKMTDGSYSVGKTNKEDFPKYNEWRDISYYEFIREQISKIKSCPNFVNMFGYFISESCGIDFDKLNEIKGITKPSVPISRTMQVDEDGNKMPDENPPFMKNQTEKTQCEESKNKVVVLKSIMDKSKNLKNGDLVQIDSKIKVKPVVPKSNDLIFGNNPEFYSGKALIVLTESPTYNLFGWASKTYQIEGNIKRMVNRGLHTEREWFGVMFQLIAALYALQISGIYIENFRLEDNVFIKDLPIRGAVTNYWKYKIDDVEYYIPNDGYMVLIDSNFTDIRAINDSTTLLGSIDGISTISNKKIGGKCLGQFCEVSDADIKKKTFDMFKSAFDVNAFGKDFIANGGCRPPDNVIRLMEKIFSDSISDKSYDISNHILNNMTKFINNRVGTYLKETEAANIRKDDMREFVKGQIVVYETGHGTHKFVLFIETLNGKAKILSKSDPANVDHIEENVHVSSLFNYSKAEPITQTFKPNEASMNEDDLLETYIIKN